MKFEKLVPLKDENGILKNWIFTDKVYVSIICTCFNQESYIKDAIDGFLGQETEYRFEIIIHDDCSNDNTHNIALHYQKKYPNIIKVIQPNNNLYSSKGINYVLKNAVIYSDGEYIALCEGDDFWIDKHKLQKQIVELEKNKDINICFTAAYGLDKSNFIKMSQGVSDCIFRLDDVVLGGGIFMPTASLMIRRHIFNNLPEWYFKAPVGDYYLQMLSSINGAIYLYSFTSCYRMNAFGSWSEGKKNRSVQELDKEWDEQIIYLNHFFAENNVIINDKIKKTTVANMKCAKGLDYLKIGEFLLSYKIYCKYLNKSDFNSKKVNFVKNNNFYILVFLFLFYIKLNWM